MGYIYIYIYIYLYMWDIYIYDISSSITWSFSSQVKLEGNQVGLPVAVESTHQIHKIPSTGVWLTLSSVMLKAMVTSHLGE